VGVFSGTKRSEGEEEVGALSVYRDRYDMGRKCMSPSPGPVSMKAVNHEFRACGEENTVKAHHVWLLRCSP